MADIATTAAESPAGLPGIYVRLIGSRIRSHLQYRGSFVMRIVASFAFSAVDFVAIAVIFSHLPLLAGWSFAEVAFLYATSYIAIRLGDLFVGHIESLPTFIRQGTFDTFLTRPLGSLFQVLTSEFELRQVGGMAQATVIFGIAVSRLDVPFTPDRVAMTALLIAAGTAIFCGIWVIGNSITFWLIDSREVANAFTYGGNALTSYPLNIYGPWLRRLLAFAIPVAFVNYFPALYILDRADPLGLPRALQFASPLVAAVVAATASVVWRVAVRHYRSTGS